MRAQVRHKTSHPMANVTDKLQVSKQQQQAAVPFCKSTIHSLLQQGTGELTF